LGFAFLPVKLNLLDGLLIEIVGGRGTFCGSCQGGNGMRFFGAVAFFLLFFELIDFLQNQIRIQRRGVALGEGGRKETEPNKRKKGGESHINGEGHFR